MTKYLVFAGLQYYPRGGWKDLRAVATTLDVAKHLAEGYTTEMVGDDWAQVVELNDNADPRTWHYTTGMYGNEQQGWSEAQD